MLREASGRSTYFRANKEHPFFPEISSIVRKTFGIDRLVEQVMADLGEVQAVYILDDYAQGCDSGLIDVLIVGAVDSAHLENLRQVTEDKINRKLRIMTMAHDEFEESRDVFLKRPHWKVV